MLESALRVFLGLAGRSATHQPAELGEGEEATTAEAIAAEAASNASFGDLLRRAGGEIIVEFAGPGRVSVRNREVALLRYQ